MANRSLGTRGAGVIVVLGLAGFRAGLGAADTQGAYVATPVLDFEYHGKPPMRMPTAVAIGGDGSVFVADGVNDRILHFNPNGELVQEIGELSLPDGGGSVRLSRPIAVKVVGHSYLWIADTGSGRVLVRAADGELARSLVVGTEPSESAGRAPDITDVAVSPDGKTVWIVDNDNHRIVRVELEGPNAARTHGTVGERGEQLGQFQYPFMAAAGRDGELFVVDVLNARVQVFTASGKPSGSIGTYGVGVGQLYRPKGIAPDAEGNVWIADSILGVVQVFTVAGSFIGVLRDHEGAPFRLETPVGLAFDSDGSLYVAELLPGRVRKLRIDSNFPRRWSDAPLSDPAAIRDARKPSVPADAQIGDGRPRRCTVCHIEWLPPFSEGRGTPLMDVPPNPPEQPAASRSESCLSCHDGSVVDSRRAVWQEHGHRDGVRPRESMAVPPRLPLVNGRIACRTCHAAHAGGTPDGSTDGLVPCMQVTADASCVACHVDQTGGLELGMHPGGNMGGPMPPALAEAGAKVEPGQRQVTCQVCHTAHGDGADRLVVMGTKSDRLCLTCHAQMGSGLFREDSAAGHPLNPKATPQRVTVLEQLGAAFSPDGRLLCLSCHKLHHGQGERFLLVAELAEGRFCLRCHADQQAVLASAHDLRRQFPDVRNALGLTPESGGPCSSCHLAHRPARPLEDHPLDPGGGRCLTCHQEGRCAESKKLGPINHPHVRCAVCHDPHQAARAAFLRRPATDLCIECHELAEDLSGGHEFKKQPDLTNAYGQRAVEVGACLMCHSMHRGVARPLWGAALTPPTTDQEKCSVCHSPGGLAASKTIREFNHPLACTQCHNPHGNSDENPALLVVAPPAQNLCVRCHDENAGLANGPHDLERRPSAWPPASQEKADRCLACHRPHADQKAGLFTNGLASGMHGPDAACLACHPHAAWGAESERAALHPRTATRLDPEDEDLPLVTADGGGEYRIGCRTCHNPHQGAGPPTHLVRAEEDEPTAALCLRCHEEMKPIALTGHSRASLNRAGLESDSCKPCHRVHGNPGTVTPSLLWGLAMNSVRGLPADRRCRGCHRQDGPVPPPAIASHPDVPMVTTVAPDTAGFLPLFNPGGEADLAGQLSCMTCHLPHGRPPAANEPADARADPLSFQRQRAMRRELRRFVMPNLCTGCHGLNGLRRFLYFHDPERRAGSRR